MSAVQFRVPTYDDIPMILDWIMADQEHSEKNMSPYFFFEKGTMSMVLEDEYGVPGIFVRVDPEPPDSVRLHIQFGPEELRSAKTMLRGWPEFMERVWVSGVKRMVFESISDRLIGFCCRAFHFKRIGKTDHYELLKEAA